MVTQTAETVAGNPATPRPRASGVPAAPVAIVIFVLVLGNALWWGRGVTFGNAPDEPDHYAMVKYVAEHGRLPHYGDPGFTVSLMNGEHEHIANPTSARSIMSLLLRPEYVELRQTYLFVPQLPYALNGWLCRLLGGATPTRARFFPALCVAGVGLCVFLAACALWPNRLLPAAVAGLGIGLWPQLTFLGAYVNDDAFAMLSASTLVAAAAWCQNRGFDRRRAVALGAALGLVGASKPYVLVLLPLAALWFWRWSTRRVEGSTSARAPGFRRRLALALGVAALIVAPWLIRNAILYEGDPTGHRYAQKQLRAFVAMLDGILPVAKQLSVKPPHGRPNPREFGRPWFKITFESFWARFGWMKVLPPHGLITSALAVLALGLAWSLRPRGRASAARPPTSAALAWWGVPRVFGLPALALLLLASMANSYYVDFQPQGRYLLPCAPALVLQVAGGLGGENTGLVARLLLVLWLLFFVFQNLTCRLSVLS